MVFLLISCKKENLDAEKPTNPNNEYLIPKIKSWLEEQKNGLPTVSVARIDSLKLNLVMAKSGWKNIKIQKSLS